MILGFGDVKNIFDLIYLKEELIRLHLGRPTANWKIYSCDNPVSWNAWDDYVVVRKNKKNSLTILHYIISEQCAYPFVWVLYVY